MNTLTISNVSHAFTGLQAVSNFSLEVNTGEIIGIIGPNGAGKTTVFNVLCGIYSLQHGTIHLDDKCLHGLPVYQIMRAGIARTFQTIRLFKALSVLDNVLIAIRNTYQISSALLKNKLFKQQEQEAMAKAFQLLQRFELARYMNNRACDLPYGFQRRLEIARALATQPKVVLLDEPACGMNPSEAKDLALLIREIQQEEKLAILLIDHQMPFVMSLCQRIFVLNFGKIIAMGDPDTICRNSAVIESYLGEA
jgi:branched-chain amino acid transport system ATP-binding protein